MKQKINIAAQRPKPKNLSRNHYTTLGFGSPFPIFVEEAIPKDKFNMRVSNFSRLAPQYLPNLGNIQLKLHAFYVPFRLVWNHFENFREGLPSWNSSGANVFKNVPLIDDIALTDLFTPRPDARYVLAEPTVSDSDNPDFVICTTNGYKGYKFNVQGKQVYHMLIALGYNFKFITPYAVSSIGAHNQTYSALPLMCWLKCFLDYFIPSQLQPSSYINKLYITVHELTSAEISSPIDSSLILDCISEIGLYYQNNYFTSSWLFPNAPVSGLNNIGSTSTDTPVINAIESQKSARTQVNQPIQNTASAGVITQNVSGQSLSNQYQLSADGLTFLQKFARYVKRSNFAGSRAVERILARFGVRVEDFQIGMSRYLGSESLDLQKSDVTVTGSTAEAGDFAGKSFFSGGSNRVFKCDCDLAGMIIISASLETPSTFLSGVRRRNYHKTPLDFYTPELDGSTMQAISGSEVFSRLNFVNQINAPELTDMGLDYDNVFGYTPRYSEYKFALDDISGDFALLSYNANIDPFILPRRIFDEGSIYPLVTDGNAGDFSLRELAYDPQLQIAGNKINPVRSLFGNDQIQFNRIFKETDGLADPVFSVFKIDCIVNSVSLPLNESAEIDGKGAEMEFETNGVHLS